MNRVNPLYLIALGLTILIISFMFLNQEKDSLNKEYRSFIELKQKAKEFKDFKANWFNENKTIKKIDRLVKSSSFRNTKILKSKVGNIIKIKVESFDSKILQKFLTKILNEKVLIKKLELKKQSIYLEIGVK